MRPDPVRTEDRKPEQGQSRRRDVAKTFAVKIRRTAMFELEISVEALNRKAAQERALESVEHQPFDPERAKLREELLRGK